jgi:zinc protease
VDRRAPPPAGEPRIFEWPPFERYALATGLEIFLAPSRAVPTVELALLLPAGAERNPPERPGLASLTASLVDEGTRRRSGPAIAADLERLGGNLSTRADWNTADLSVDLLAEDVATGVDLLAELAREPVFPPEEVERLRRQTLTELLRRRDQPAILAEEAIVRALYPGSPYGELLLGSEAAVRVLAREELARFHADNWRPRGGALLVGGDFDVEATRRRIEAVFGDWRGEPAAPAPAIVPPARAARSVLLVDRPAAAQTELRIAHVGVPRTHPDRNRLVLLNTLLGGKFTSRINLNLRERHGFTYGASSRFVERRGPGPFVVAAAVATAVAGAAAREALGELARIREEPVTARELAETKSYLLGVFPYTLQTVGGRLARLEELALYGLPDDHFQRSLAEIERLTAAELLVAAREHIHPETALIVGVGPAAELAPQLESLGEVTVVEVEESS